MKRSKNTKWFVVEARLLIGKNIRIRFMCKAFDRCHEYPFLGESKYEKGKLVAYWTFAEFEDVMSSVLTDEHIHFVEATDLSGLATW